MPQGSVLGPLLFIIYINDLPNCLSRSRAILFADDTTIYLSSKHIETLYNHINYDLNKLSDWFRANKLSLNVGKTNCTLFKLNNNPINEKFKIKLGQDTIEHKNVVKFLGMNIDSKLKWHEHINSVRNKLNSSMYALNKVKHILNPKHLMTLYYSLIYPYIDYGISLWGSSHSSYINKLVTIQKRAVRIIKRVKYNEHTSPIFKDLNILKIKDIYHMQVAKYMYNMTRGTLPTPLTNQIKLNSNLHTHNTRNINNPHITQRRTNLASRAIRHKGPYIWYSIQENTRTKRTIKSFQSNLKKNIFASY